MFRMIATGAFVVGLTMVGAPAFAQQVPPDNTRTNKTDRDSAKPTADQQQNNKTDLSITQSIRRSIVADKTLSSYAHNVKIVALHGEVTLRGPVRTDEEKKVVEGKAAEVVGADHVKSEVLIAPAKQSKPQS